MNFLNFFTKNKLPYGGGERAARSYRDWYVLVATSFLCLVTMIAGYGYLVLFAGRSEVLSSDVLIERTLFKVKPGEVESLAGKIGERQAYFSQLSATGTVPADPSR